MNKWLSFNAYYPFTKATDNTDAAADLTLNVYSFYAAYIFKHFTDIRHGIQSIFSTSLLCSNLVKLWYLKLMRYSVQQLSK